MGLPTPGCLTNEQLAVLARGDPLEAALRHGAHLDSCASCGRVLTALQQALAPALQPTLTTPVGNPTLTSLPQRPEAEQQIFTTAERFVSPGGVIELGRGGLGRVLRVQDQALGRDVALKEILEVPEAARAMVERRFVREARLTGQLEHPGIVPVYDFGRGPEGRLFYAMRRIEGRTLADAVESAGTLAQRLGLVPHVLALAQAVAYAHSRGVIHRDIKPQNVMVGAFGETLLLDWGLARAQGEAGGLADVPQLPSEDARLSRAGVAMGTPAYMPPEQARGNLEAIDAQSDQWALGAVLYHVVCGHPPYWEGSVAEVLIRATEGKVPRLEALEPGVPRELAAIANTCLQPHKADRYPDVAAMVKDLSAWLGGRRVSAHQYTALERARRFAREHRVAVVATATALLVLLSASAASYVRLRRERNEYRMLSMMVLTRGIKALGHTPGNRELIEELATTVQQTLSRIGSYLDAPFEDRVGLKSAASVLAASQFETLHFAEAVASRRLSCAMADSLITERPDEAAWLGVAAEEHGFLAIALFRLGVVDEAQGELDRAFALLEAAKQRLPDHRDVINAETIVLGAAVEIQQARGRYLEVLALAERSIEVERRYVELLGMNSVDLYNTVVGYQQLADVARLAGRRQRALEAVALALADLKQFETRFAGTNDWLEASFEIRVPAARLALDEGDREQALGHLAQGRAALDALLLHEPRNLHYLMMLVRLRMIEGGRDELGAALAQVRAEPGFEEGGDTVVPASFIVWEPEQLLEEVAAHPVMLDSSIAKVCASLAAALAQRPAQAAALMDQAVASGERLDDWPAGLFRERGLEFAGPAAEAVKRMAGELDATDAPRDDARRVSAMKRFAEELRALARDAG